MISQWLAHTNFLIFSYFVVVKLTNNLNISEKLLRKMKTVFILSCLCAMAVSVPVVQKVRPATAEFPGFIQVEASNPVEAVRKARQLFDIDIDIYNNNGAGYFGIKKLIASNK